jgi:shikimate kinase
MTQGDAHERAAPRLKPQRIVLIGFMGSGKSTVGKILAARLGWDFVDTDEVVQERTGAPVTRIFEELGERAFREKEAHALASLEQRTRLVIATGGGAPAQPRNARFFSGSVSIFHLRVSLETVRERTRGNKGRPLLALSESALRSLYDSRQPVYNALGSPVETEGKEPAEVAEEILRLLGTQESQSAQDS